MAAVPTTQTRNTESANGYLIALFNPQSDTPLTRQYGNFKDDIQDGMLPASAVRVTDVNISGGTLSVTRENAAGRTLTIPTTAGPRGPKGDKGDKGDTGATGARGSTGPTGPKGDKGNQGSPGNQGERGPQGSRGPAGSIGPAGTQGPKGDKGDQGDTGPAGSSGDDGAQGPRGAFTVDVFRLYPSATTSVPAPTGGSVAADGTVTAPTGWSDNPVSVTAGHDLWESRANIDPASVAFPVTPIWSVGFEAGEAGPAGPQGIQGETGPTGPRGPKGDKGDTGDTGPKGDKGDKGDTGDTGSTGPQGDTGPQGTPGTAGSLALTIVEALALGNGTAATVSGGPTSALNDIIYLDITYTRSGNTVRMAHMMLKDSFSGVQTYSLQLQGGGGAFIVLSTSSGNFTISRDSGNTASGYTDIGVDVYNVSSGTQGPAGPAGADSINLTVSGNAPSGGAAGDLWIQVDQTEGDLTDVITIDGNAAGVWAELAEIIPANTNNVYEANDDIIVAGDNVTLAKDADAHTITINSEAGFDDTNFGLVYRTDWGSLALGHAFLVGDIVPRNDQWFMCITANTKGAVGPDNDSSNWEPITNFAGTYVSTAWYHAGAYVAYKTGLAFALQDIVPSDPAPDADTNTKWLVPGVGTGSGDGGPGAGSVEATFSFDPSSQTTSPLVHAFDAISMKLGDTFVVEVDVTLEESGGFQGITGDAAVSGGRVHQLGTDMNYRVGGNAAWLDASLAGGGGQTLTGTARRTYHVLEDADIVVTFTFRNKSSLFPMQNWDSGSDVTATVITPGAAGGGAAFDPTQAAIYPAVLPMLQDSDTTPRGGGLHWEHNDSNSTITPVLRDPTPIAYRQVTSDDNRASNVTFRNQRIDAPGTSGHVALTGTNREIIPESIRNHITGSQARVSTLEVKTGQQDNTGKNTTSSFDKADVNLTNYGTHTIFAEAAQDLARLSIAIEQQAAVATGSQYPVYLCTRLPGVIEPRVLATATLRSGPPTWSLSWTGDGILNGQQFYLISSHIIGDGLWTWNPNKGDADNLNVAIPGYIARHEFAHNAGSVNQAVASGQASIHDKVESVTFYTTNDAITVPTPGGLGNGTHYPLPQLQNLSASHHFTYMRVILAGGNIQFQFWGTQTGGLQLVQQFNVNIASAAFDYRVR